MKAARIEIAIEVANLKIEHADGLGAIDDGRDIALASELAQIGDRQQCTVRVLNMREREYFRLVGHRPCNQAQRLLRARHRRGQVDLLNDDTAASRHNEPGAQCGWMFA
jgi:hypothetical protein